MEIITKLPEKQGLAEIYQDMRVKMALLRPVEPEKYERITPMVLCRDFLCDVYTFSEKKLDFQIYGMQFKGSKEQPSRKGVYLLLQFPTPIAKEQFANHLELLHEIEKKNNIPLTAVQEFNATQSVVIGDKYWLKTCLLFSLYTLLLRALCYEFKNEKGWLQKLGNQKFTDSNYIKSVSSATWEHVLGDLSSISVGDFCGFEVKVENTSMIHHNSGFISVFGKHSEIWEDYVRQNNHWKLMKDKGLALATK